jgi:uncharacterized protein YcaQ
MSVREKYEAMMQHLAAQAAEDEQERQRRKAAGGVMADQLHGALAPDAAWFAERGYKLASDGARLTLTGETRQIACDCQDEMIKLRVFDLTNKPASAVEHMTATLKSVEAAEEMIADLVRQLGSMAPPKRRRGLFGS